MSRTAKGEVDQAEAEKLSTELLEKAERFDANAKRLEQEQRPRERWQTI